MRTKTVSFAALLCCAAVACNRDLEIPHVRPADPAVRFAITGATRRPLVQAGSLTTCALDYAGRAFCWGDNTVGQLGTGSSGGQGPVAVLTTHTFADLDLSDGGGFAHACAVDIDPVTHGVYCWGRLSTLPAGSTSFAYVPTLVDSSHPYMRVSTGGAHDCMIDNQNVGYCFGTNYYGELGNGSTAPFGQPVMPPVLISGSFTWESVTAATNFTCGRDVAGLAYCWGGFQTQSNAPRTVGLTSTSSISASGSGFACAVSGGATYCWGGGSNGQLGTGVLQASMPAPSTPVVGNHSFTQVSTGYSHACGVTLSHAVYCWGSNALGELGNETTQQTGTPDSVHHAPEFISVSAGTNHTCATTQAGEIFCWGYNNQGQVGVPQSDSQTCLVDGFTAYCLTSPRKVQLPGFTLPPPRDAIVFPVRGPNVSPLTAQVVSVFDHARGASPYQPNRVVQAFTGAVGGPRNACHVSALDVYGNDQHQAYNLRPWATYKGVSSCGGTRGLSYDGHPGYDYSYPKDTPLYPAITGIATYRLPGDGIRSTRAAAWHTLAIIQTDATGKPDPNGRRVVYLHLANWLDEAGNPVRCGRWKAAGDNVTCSQTVPCPNCAREGELVSVDRAEPIAYVGNYATAGANPVGGWGMSGTFPHLHFEVSKRGCPTDAACRAVDPYGWKGTPGTDPFEAATGVANTWLWAVPDPTP